MGDDFEIDWTELDAVAEVRPRAQRAPDLVIPAPVAAPAPAPRLHAPAPTVGDVAPALTEIAATSGIAAPKDPTYIAPTTRGDTNAPASNGIAFVPSGPSIFDLPRDERPHVIAARRAAELAVQASDAPRTLNVAPGESSRPYLQPGQLVAGAAAEGHGVLVGWTGKGDMTRAVLCATLARAGLSTEWAPDAASARAQAGRAVGALAGQGFDVRAERKSDRQTVEAVTYDHRWTVGRVDHAGNVGDHFGEIALVATLTGDRLVVEGDAQLSQTVLDDYHERIGSELYRSSDVTGWIASVLRRKLDAVRFGVGWYVPRKHVAVAGQLCSAFARSWGTDWICPALPVATSDRLSAGILRGLAGEVDSILHRLDVERANVRDAGGKATDIGHKRAATFLRELREVAERVAAYGALLGPARVAELRDRVRGAIVALEASLSPDDLALVQRFEAVWDEIALDVRNAGGEL